MEKPWHSSCLLEGGICQGGQLSKTRLFISKHIMIGIVGKVLTSISKILYEHLNITVYVLSVLRGLGTATACHTDDCPFTIRC